MKTKIYLTSAIAMGFVCPAFAEPTNTENSFPSNGLMAEDTTYTNAATSTNMAGVYENEVNAVAEYENILYQIGAGQYLPAGGESVISCDQPGSFCPGVSGDVTYNANSAQGLSSCSTATSGLFTSSDGTGSSAESCYRACNISNMGSNGTISTIAHATALSGNDYYGSGTDTCEPTACENGWHVKEGLNLTSTMGTDGGVSNAYINNNGQFGEVSAAHGQSYYGINGANTWAVDYDTRGMLIGQSRCSKQAGDGTLTNPTITANLADETGQEGAKYCYCNVTGYTPDVGTLQAVLSPWVSIGASYDASKCASYCASNCANYMMSGFSDYSAFRAAVFGAIEPIPAMCEANTITINWTDASSADISANNAGTATYGEDVRTPVKATTKPGQRFKGWRFVAPTPVQVGE